MTTYVWSGAVDANITNSNNWIGGVAPVGGPDTKVVIGHPYGHRDHEITNWPSGGHLDMEIKYLYINPSWDLQTSGTGPIKIGQPTDYLKFDKVRYCKWGSGFSQGCFIEPGSQAYLHMEQWPDGPSSTLSIEGRSPDGTHSSKTPNYELHLLGNPDSVPCYYIKGLELYWGSTSLNISGGLATQSENGPAKFGEPIAFVGVGHGFENSKVTLDWQQTTNGGNPIKDCVLDMMGSMATIIADTYDEGILGGDPEKYYTPTGSLVLTAGHIGEYSTPEQGNEYHILPLEGLSGETSPVVIPSLSLIGGPNYASDTAYGENTTTLYVDTGVTVGGDNFYGIKLNWCDVIFSPEAATSTFIKSGKIYWRSRVDASKLTAGSFTMSDLEGDTYVTFDTMRGNPSGFGGATYAQVRVSPPAFSNIKTN